MARPILFLDVDGVLNAFDGLNKGDWDDFVKKDVYAPEGGVYGTMPHKFRMRISRKMCDRLSALDLDIWWATTWEHYANLRLAHLTGLPELPVACRIPEGLVHEDLDEVTKWWKFDGIYKMIEADPRPFIWADDEAIPPFAEERFDVLGVPYLLIKPDEKVGLTHVDTDKMLYFVNEHRSSESTPGTDPSPIG